MSRRHQSTNFIVIRDTTPEPRHECGPFPSDLPSGSVVMCATCGVRWKAKYWPNIDCRPLVSWTRRFLIGRWA